MVPVTSRVLHGPVVGPVLLLMYINVLPENITSKVCFACDSALYLTLEGTDDSLVLQYLDRLYL